MKNNLLFNGFTQPFRIRNFLKYPLIPVVQPPFYHDEAQSVFHSETNSQDIIWRNQTSQPNPQLKEGPQDIFEFPSCIFFLENGVPLTQFFNA